MSISFEAELASVHRLERIARLLNHGREALLAFVEQTRVRISQTGTAYEDRPHVKATLRCLQAWKDLRLGEKERSSTALAQEKLSSLVEDSYANPAGTSFGRHTIYSHTNLFNICKLAGLPQREKFEAILLPEIEALVAQENPSTYLLLVCVDLPPLKNLEDRIAQISYRAVNDGFAAFAAGIVEDFDAARFAAGLVLLEKYRPLLGPALQPRIERMIASGVDLLFNEDRFSVALRLPKVQFGIKNARIHSVQWEELLIASRLPSRYFDIGLTLVDRVLKSMEAGMIFDGDRCQGWTHESDLNYPSPMSWFTAINVSLLCVLQDIYGGCYTSEFLRFAEKTGIGSIERMPDGKIENGINGWDDLVETDLKIKDRIFREILGAVPSLAPLKRSLLLFGPPGTAKTTFVKGIAHSLRRTERGAPTTKSWPLLTINPADFSIVLDGDGSLIGVKNLFACLSKLRQVVIFLDEAENVILDRDNDYERRKEKMLTGAMLPLLSEIVRGDVLVVMATNYIGRIDIAARRRGRFELRLGVSLPSREARATLLAKVHGIEQGDAQQLSLQCDGMTIKETLAFGRSVVTRGRAQAELIATRMKMNPEIKKDVLAGFEADVDAFHDREY